MTVARRRASRRPTAILRRPPAREVSQDIVEAVLRAAEELMMLHGVRAATTNKIASRAGVSIGSLYRYFPNKQAIIAHLDLRHRERFAQALGATLAELGHDLPAALAAAVQMFLVPPAPELALRQTFMRSVPLEWIEQSATKIWGALTEPCAALLRRHRPELDETTARRRVIIALHATQGVALASALWAAGDLPPDAAAPELTRLLVAYLLHT